MRRRAFVATTPSSIVTLGGCSDLETESGESARYFSTVPPDQERSQNIRQADDESKTDQISEGPNPTIQDLINCEPRMVSVDKPEERTYIGTIQNTGHSGQIAIALFWLTSEDADPPPSVDTDQIVSSVQKDWIAEDKKELFFEADERRTVEFTATPPRSYNRYLIRTESASYGAVVTNDGSAGEVTTTLRERSELYENRILERKSVFLAEDSEREILFNTILPPQAQEWEIHFED